MNIFLEEYMYKHLNSESSKHSTYNGLEDNNFLPLIKVLVTRLSTGYLRHLV